MNDILIQALKARVKAGDIKPEEVPIPYQEAVAEVVEEEGD